jgi:hypothetical protein
MPGEADTCRKYVVPKLQTAGWDNEPHSIAEQRTITDGRIVPVGKGFIRKPPKRVDYLLRFRCDFPLAVVEAKAAYKTAADGRVPTCSPTQARHQGHPYVEPFHLFRYLDEQAFRFNARKVNDAAR